MGKNCIWVALFLCAPALEGQNLDQRLFTRLEQFLQRPGDSVRLDLDYYIYCEASPDFDPNALTYKTIALYLRQNNLHVEIAAHTDCQGNDAYNLKLSQRQAAYVRTVLTGEGVGADRIRAVGYGESKPIVDCACLPVEERKRECRYADNRENRRMVIRVTD